MKNCIIIPTHPHKVNWLILFLNSIPSHEIHDLNFDIILAVSNSLEKQQIENTLRIAAPLVNSKVIYFNVDLYIREEIKDQIAIDRYTHNSNKCIVNLKKFVAMHWAMPQYEYCTVIDSDVIFYKSAKSTFDKIIHNYQENRYFGAPSEAPGIQKIIEDCASFFDKDEVNQLREITNNLSVYTWFIEPPTYHQADLRSFFDYFLSNDRAYNFWEKINWHSFEHIIFVFYKLLHKNAILIDYSQSQIGAVIPEALTHAHLNILKQEYNYSPSWVRFKLLLDGLDNVQSREPSLLYHVDRM